MSYPILTTLAFLALSGPAMAACQDTRADVSGNGHVLTIRDEGYCNTTQLRVRGHATRLALSQTGHWGDTRVFSHGTNRDMSFENRGDRATVFAGACPRGSRHQRLETPGRDETLVLVPRCD